jgi:hypothetical protein
MHSSRMLREGARADDARNILGHVEYRRDPKFLRPDLVASNAILV